MSAAVDLVYRYRDWISLPPAALVLVLLLGATAQQVVKKLAPSHHEVQVDLSVPPPPAVKAPEPPRTQPPAAPQAQAQARPVAAEPQQTPTHSAEAPSAPSPVAAPVATPVAHAAPAAPAPVAAPAPAPAPHAAPRVEHESVQNAFTAKIKADVLARKSYPRGREASLEKPRGIVRAWLELDRSGAVRDVGIETGSGSMILDGAARKLLRGGSYPAFPEAAFPGETSHRFYFDLDYQPSAAS